MPAPNASYQSAFTPRPLGLRNADCGNGKCHGRMRGICPGVLMPMLPTLLCLATMQGGTPPSLTAPEILESMVRADNGRAAALAGYSGVRRYRFDNLKSGKHAELTVRMSRGSDGVKTFEVLAASGSGFVRDHILRKMIEAEAESSQKGERNETRISFENYAFRLVGTEARDGPYSYVPEINPKRPSKFTSLCRIWVDAQDFAITRIEGQPAKNPS